MKAKIRIFTIKYQKQHFKGRKIEKLDKTKYYSKENLGNHEVAPL